MSDWAVLVAARRAVSAEAEASMSDLIPDDGDAIIVRRAWQRVPLAAKRQLLALAHARDDQAGHDRALLEAAWDILSDPDPREPGWVGRITDAERARRAAVPRAAR